MYILCADSDKRIILMLFSLIFQTEICDNITKLIKILSIIILELELEFEDKNKNKMHVCI